jgi:excisionase family DNA binding protein
MSDEKLTVYEAAQYLHCRSHWVRILLAEQRLDGAQKVDGQWRIPIAALEALKRQREAVSA